MLNSAKNRSNIALAGMIAAALVGCTSPAYRPTLNPSPQLRYTIDVQMETQLAANFRVVYISSISECLIHRPVLGGDVVRTAYGAVVAAPTALQASAIDLWLDEYLPGTCGWRASSIEVSVNLRAFSASAAQWLPLASVDLPGAAGADEVAYECRAVNPRRNVMWCRGPLAFVSSLPGRLQLSIRVNNDIDFW